MAKSLLTIIQLEDRKKYRCAICDETESVKYFTPIYDPVQSSNTIMAPICNECALKMCLAQMSKINKE